MPDNSFDVVSKIEMPEVHNAVQQALKEITQRYDLKDSKSTIEVQEKDNKILLHSKDEFKLKAVVEILQAKMVKRSVPLKNLIYGNIIPSAGTSVKQEITLQNGIAVEKAREVSRWAHFGEGGRGYAGSTRWAGYAGTTIAENLARDRAETIVLAQIEDAAALDVVEAIAEVPGIDSLFVGPADLAVALGVSTLTDPAVLAGYDRVAAAAKRCGRNVSTFAATAEAAIALRARGVTSFLIGSELTFVLSGTRAAAEEARKPPRR